MSKIDCILYPPTLDYNYLVQRPQQLMKHFSELEIPSFFLNLASPQGERLNGIEKPNPYLYLFNNVDPRPYLQDLRPVVYFSAAWHIDIVQQYNPSLLVFDSVDEPSDEFESWKPYYLRAISQADIVLNTSDKLYESAKSINPYSYLVPNGCDYEYFSQAADGALPVPADIAQIPGPIIGYIGVVATWVDLQLIDRLAVEFPQCSIVVVGPLYNVSNVPQRSNIHWLGFKPYEQLAAYTQQFSVGIIPFIQSDMTESVNPIKMWEYMAAGVPVVTTAIPEASKYQDLVFPSYSHEEFIFNIDRALKNDSPDWRHQRMALAGQNTWGHRARQILGIIEQRLEEKGLAQSGGYASLASLGEISVPAEPVWVPTNPQTPGTDPFPFVDLSLSDEGFLDEWQDDWQDDWRDDCQDFMFTRDLVDERIDSIIPTWLPFLLLTDGHQKIRISRYGAVRIHKGMANVTETNFTTNTRKNRKSTNLRKKGSTQQSTRRSSGLGRGMCTCSGKAVRIPTGRLLSR